MRPSRWSTPSRCVLDAQTSTTNPNIRKHSRWAGSWRWTGSVLATDRVPSAAREACLRFLVGTGARMARLATSPRRSHARRTSRPSRQVPRATREAARLNPRTSPRCVTRGVELQAARRIGRRLVPHAAAGATVVDDIFQTNAQTFGQPDHTRLQATGLTLTTSAGIGYAVTERFTIAADFFYAPLTVRRTASSASSTDPMVNARALVSYRMGR
jgi:hypothetical protein